MKRFSNYSTIRISTIFLQILILLLGAVALTLLLVEPHFEGRNAQVDFFQVYFNDPFLVYVYLGSIPFFVALFHTFRLLSYIRQGKLFTKAAVGMLKIIKYCAFITAGTVVAAGVYLRITAERSDDPAGAIMLGLIAASTSIVIGVVAVVLEITLKIAIYMKLENERLKKTKKYQAK